MKHFLLAVLVVGCAGCGKEPAFPYAEEGDYFMVTSRYRAWAITGLSQQHIVCRDGPALMRQDGGFTYEATCYRREYSK